MNFNDILTVVSPQAYMEISDNGNVATAKVSDVLAGVAGAPGTIAWGSIIGTVANQGDLQALLNLKAALVSPTFTGTPSLPTGTIVVTQSAGNSTTAPASTAFVTTADNLKAPLASPTFTGILTTPLIKITSGSPGLGKVLTSDADGDGSWQAVNGVSSVANIGLTATGDGTTDDRAAIQSAYDTAYTGGYRQFYLPKGTYRMSLSAGVGIYACLFIKPGTTLFGDGDDTVIKRHSGDLLGVTITYDKTSHNAAALSARNYTLRDFKILGTTGRGYETPIGSSETEGGIFLATAANRTNKVLIENVTVDTLNKEAIAVWDAVECTIRNNRVYNCNFDAYNPQLIGSLILTGNYASGCNIGCEYEGKRTGGILTNALIEGNEFVDIWEYGIGVEAGDYIKISNNLLVGQIGSTTVTSQSIGLYLLPNQGDIGTLELTGNQVINFIQGGMSNSVPVTGDYVCNRLIIKDNTFVHNGENCIRLKAFSTAKILQTDIIGNSCINWNRIDNGNSFQWSAIHLELIDNVSVHGNTFKNVVNGRRNDPVYVNNATNVRFYGNDCVGPVSEFYPTLEPRFAGTTTGWICDGNKGLYGGLTGETVTVTIPVGDETTTITTGSVKVTYRMPFPMRLTSVRASLSTVSSSGNLTVDVNAAGSSVFSTLLTINASSKTSIGATPSVLSNYVAGILTALGIADDAEITVDIDAAGTGAKGLKVYLIGYK